jgi:hypothetical protein
MREASTEVLAVRAGQPQRIQGQDQRQQRDRYHLQRHVGAAVAHGVGRCRGRQDDGGVGDHHGVDQQPHRVAAP